nr:hypothetical protein 1 [Hubei tombus-like virus 38]
MTVLLPVLTSAKSLPYYIDFVPVRSSVREFHNTNVHVIREISLCDLPSVTLPTITPPLQLNDALSSVLSLMSVLPYQLRAFETLAGHYHAMHPEDQSTTLAILNSTSWIMHELPAVTEKLRLHLATDRQAATDLPNTVRSVQTSPTSATQNSILRQKILQILYHLEELDLSRLSFSHASQTLSTPRLISETMETANSFMQKAKSQLMNRWSQ